MSEQVIRIMCPNLACRKILAVPIATRGKVVKCSSCQRNIRVPATPSAHTHHAPTGAPQQAGGIGSEASGKGGSSPSAESSKT